MDNMMRQDKIKLMIDSVKLKKPKPCPYLIIQELKHNIVKKVKK